MTGDSAIALKISICGGGIAACCCAYLLKQSGFRVFMEQRIRARLPVVLLSRTAQDLLADVFGPQDFLGACPRLSTRTVAWGADSKPAVLNYSAVAAPEEWLLERLGKMFSAESPGSEPADWTIFTAQPFPANTTVHRFGSRVASVTPVETASNAGHPGCWIESVEDGWLFLVSTNPESGWVLSVGDPSSDLVAQSRFVKERIVKFGQEIGPFAASPHMLVPGCGPGWLACGASAIAFDPICGDGIAHAIRESILAAAVIRAVSAGASEAGLLEHYRHRIVAAMRQHLGNCAEYYGPGQSGAWWRREAELLQRAIGFCGAELSGHRHFRYRLVDLQLHELQP